MCPDQASRVYFSSLYSLSVNSIQDKNKVYLQVPGYPFTYFGEQETVLTAPFGLALRQRVGREGLIARIKRAH